MTISRTIQAIIHASKPSRRFRRIGEFALTVMLALVCVQVAQAKSGYYQWRDDQGQMHFSQRPPSSNISTDQPDAVEANAEYVSQQKGSMFARENDDEDTKTNRQKTSENAPKIATSTDNEKSNTPSRPFEKDAQRCNDAKNNLAELSKTFRIRYVDENGKQRLLSAEEKQQQRQSALKAIEESC